MTTITLPVTTGTDGEVAFAHTGPDPQVGLYVAEPLADHPTEEDATTAALAALIDHINAGYLPTRDSRTGSRE